MISQLYSPHVRPSVEVQSPIMQAHEDGLKRSPILVVSPMLQPVTSAPAHEGVLRRTSVSGTCTVVSAGSTVVAPGPSPMLSQPVAVNTTSRLTSMPMRLGPATATTKTTASTIVTTAPARTVVQKWQSPVVTVVTTSTKSPSWHRRSDGQWEKVTSSSQPVDPAAKDDDFDLLPPPLVEFKEESGAARHLGASLNSEDGFEIDIDDCKGQDFSKDSSIRSPAGTHWVQASRRSHLDTHYSIWFNSMPKGGGRRKENQYEENLQCVGTVSSVQDFWRYWNAIDLERITDFSSLSVFKNPIKPMWEDPENTGGGEWLLRCNGRSEAEAFFTKTVLALIGGYFDSHENLCGVVYSTKPKLASLGLWMGKTSSQEREPINNELRELLNIENDEKRVLEFKAH